MSYPPQPTNLGTRALTDLHIHTYILHEPIKPNFATPNSQSSRNLPPFPDPSPTPNLQPYHLILPDMDSQFPAGGSSRHDQSHQQQQQPPAYDITVGGHYGASAALSTSLPSPQLYGGAFANVRDSPTPFIESSSSSLNRRYGIFRDWRRS